jgi:hypothetical protein
MVIEESENDCLWKVPFVKRPEMQRHKKYLGDIAATASPLSQYRFRLAFNTNYAWI